MNDISPELKKLYQNYNGDIKKLLQENPRLDYLYALSEIRENLLDWFEFKPDATLLQVGSDYGALTGLYSRRVKAVTVLDPCHNNLSFNRLRNQKQNNIHFVNNDLDSFISEEGFDYIVFCRFPLRTLSGHDSKGQRTFKTGRNADYCNFKPSGIKVSGWCKGGAVLPFQNRVKGTFMRK
ncbi:SAM-dependent methyltransferase [Lacrimispora xylanisolvens]|uniref:SAM-dependent methyltransferase n=1 Tax=Lacrimispora xylanisolvens TaxID=384636 RepID=UPI002402C76B